MRLGRVARFFLTFLIMLMTFSTLNGQATAQTKTIPEKFLGTWVETDKRGKVLNKLDINRTGIVWHRKQGQEKIGPGRYRVDADGNVVRFSFTELFGSLTTMFGAHKEFRGPRNATLTRNGSAIALNLEEGKLGVGATQTAGVSETETWIVEAETHLCSKTP